MPQTISPEILQAALAGLRLQEQKIQEQIADVESMLGGKSVTSTATTDPAKRRKFSAAARRKMALAQKARWAKLKGESKPPAPAKAPKPKRHISKEGVARITAPTKNLGRVQKAAAKAKPAAAKKAAPKKAAVKKVVAKKAAVK